MHVKTKYKSCTINLQENYFAYTGTYVVLGFAKEMTFRLLADFREMNRSI